ncbi:MAG: LysM peptidoglycan-binding domain-containing protein [Mariprofundaceae bacterium]
MITPAPAWAESGSNPLQAGTINLKPDINQPYIVRKGDTLWDIANHFFRDPKKWLEVWERNLYITNPDLIYPGNTIWFDSNKIASSGGLTTIRPIPEIKPKKVERLETPIDPSLLLTSLARQGFIQAEEMQGVGYILDSKDERINFGSDDLVYLKLDTPADEGDAFDIFRTADPIRDPKSNDIVGILVLHMGQVEIISQAGDIYRGRITKSFEEISRGDRLKPARDINTRIVPAYPSGKLNGQILYIRNNATEAGQHQVVGIDLGKRDGMQPGSVLSIHRAGRLIQDTVTGEAVQLPGEVIGELMILVPQKIASIAIITKSTASINIGDSVRNQTGK